MGYVALGLAALVLFAAPLWYAWQVTIKKDALSTCRSMRSA